MNCKVRDGIYSQGGYSPYLNNLLRTFTFTQVKS